MAMHLEIDDLNKVAEFRALVVLVEQYGQEIADLRAQLPEWVDEVEAQRLTGLSTTALWQERKRNPTSLIIWKKDHGVRYLRASLLAHNRSRAVGKGYASLTRSL